ncbi:ATP-binding protein [Salinisphaera hydrothermalis]|uniref:ATP-binding protein n=1 Tax=Salinisphaera hydrothermalis TaxID=563188 RepID=UPI0033408CBB
MPSADEAIDDSVEVARQQLQLLADISDPAIAYLDTQRRFEITNKAFKRRFGEPERGTVAGDFFDGICSPDVDQYLQRAIERRSALSAQLDCTASKDSSTERLRLQAVPHLTPDQAAGVFLVFEELETRALPSNRETSDDDEEDERMVHLQRMAKLGEMAAGLAHEVRQPLAAIGNYANALTRMLRAGKSGEDVISVVSQIGEQAKRADHIVGNARSMIGQGADRVRVFDIRRVIDDTLGLVERRARQLDVDIRYSTPSELPEVYGNPAQIEQILVNLMTNAMDSMTDCNPRVMRVEIDSTRAKTVRVRVRDSGCGIPEDRLSSIFNAFDTSKSSGMGMGLSISRALAERHGGQLWAETDIDDGASFVLELPACHDEAAPEAE